jgi:hypothetical protein
MRGDFMACEACHRRSGEAQQCIVDASIKIRLEKVLPEDFFAIFSLDTLRLARTLVDLGHSVD